MTTTPNQTPSPAPSSAPSSTKAALPLFYIRPEPLNAQVHGALTLRGEPDFRFAASTNAVPVMAGEFNEAMRFYPIVFAGDPAHPVTVMGLKADNLFVAADGQWDQARYIPAYVRRYPFVFIDAGAQGFALGVDAGCDRLCTADDAATNGTIQFPLFENGQPSALTQSALQFSGALQAEHAATRAFTDALIANDLLIDQHAHGELGDGERFALQGFRIVDAQKFAQLPETVVNEWHKSGWLGLVHLHLASLTRWRDLLDRQNQGPATKPADTQPGETPAPVKASADS
jgi:SapC